MSRVKFFLVFTAAVLMLLGCQSEKTENPPRNYRQEAKTVTEIDISTLSDKIVERLTNENYLLNKFMSDQEMEILSAQSGTIVLNDCSSISDAVGRQIQKIVIVDQPESLLVVYYENDQEVRAF